MTYLTVSPHCNTGLQTLLVNICVFARSWSNVAITRERLEKLWLWENVTDVKANCGGGEQVWEPCLEQAEGSELQWGKGQWKHRWAKEKRESRSHRPDQLQLVAGHCRRGSYRCNTWVSRRHLMTNFCHKSLQHPMSIYQCSHMLLLVRRLLFTRQSLGLESPGPGNSHIWYVSKISGFEDSHLKHQRSACRLTEVVIHEGWRVL